MAKAGRCSVGKEDFAGATDPLSAHVCCIYTNFQCPQIHLKFGWLEARLSQAAKHIIDTSLFQEIQIKKGGPWLLGKTGTTTRLQKAQNLIVYLAGKQLRLFHRGGGSADRWQLGLVIPP